MREKRELPFSPTPVSTCSMSGIALTPTPTPYNICPSFVCMSDTQSTSLVFVPFGSACLHSTCYNTWGNNLSYLTASKQLFKYTCTRIYKYIRTCLPLTSTKCCEHNISALSSFSNVRKPKPASHNTCRILVHRVKRTSCNCSINVHEK